MQTSTAKQTNQTNNNNNNTNPNLITFENIKDLTNINNQFNPMMQKITRLPHKITKKSFPHLFELCKKGKAFKAFKASEDEPTGTENQILSLLADLIEVKKIDFDDLETLTACLAEGLENTDFYYHPLFLDVVKCCQDLKNIILLILTTSNSFTNSTIMDIYNCFNINLSHKIYFNLLKFVKGSLNAEYFNMFEFFATRYFHYIVLKW